MITFPNAKINIGLQVTERRPDGYHNLDTVFYPIPLHDALEVIVAKDANYDCRLHLSGVEVAIGVTSNLHPTQVQAAVIVGIFGYDDLQRIM